MSTRLLQLIDEIEKNLNMPEQDRRHFDEKAKEALFGQAAVEVARTLVSISQSLERIASKL